MLTDEQRTEYFIELYMHALRAAYKNPFLRPPNPNSERWKNLDKARWIVDQLCGEYSDYILTQFRAFKKLKFAPKPEHLVTDKAIARFKMFQKMKNRYFYPEFALEGNELIVRATSKRYSLTQVELPATQDSLSNYALSLASNETLPNLSEEGKQRAIEALEYTICKFLFKKKPLPKGIKERLEELK